MAVVTLEVILALPTRDVHDVITITFAYKALQD